MKKWIVGLLLLVAQVGVLRWQGRVWWCVCEKFNLWVRDNLTLNVIMLIHPVEAIKAWQLAP